MLLSLRTIVIFFSIIVLGILSGFLIGCRPAERSQFEVDTWRGEVLQSGEQIHFSQLPVPGVLLNVYSPTCGPCIDELPALNQLHSIAREKGVAMFVVADGRPESHGLEVAADASPEEARAALRARLSADVKKYDIRIPLVVMDSNFRVEPRGGLVSGTPETMLFRTNPFVLDYNFVGPVASTEDVNALDQDSRFQFVVKKVLALADAGRSVDLSNNGTY